MSNPPTNDDGLTSLADTIMHFTELRAANQDALSAMSLQTPIDSQQVQSFKLQLQQQTTPAFYAQKVPQPPPVINIQTPTTPAVYHVQPHLTVPLPGMIQ